MKQDKREGPSQELPEWVWRVKTNLTTSRTYHHFRDGIDDFHKTLARTHCARVERKFFNADWRWREHQRAREMLPFSVVQEYSFPAPIECKLIVITDMHSSIPYKALSYTWGPPVLHQIGCDGASLKIQESAWLALQRFRHKSQPQFLWIDAICICQTDTEEKENQVLLMRDLYSLANEVIVWLGEASKDSSDAFDLITQIKRVSMALPGSQSKDAFTTQNLIDVGLPTHSDSCWEALDSLFWRDWFTRVWIIQEISVAKTALISCGDDMCKWEDFSLVTKFIMDHSITAITKSDPSRVFNIIKFRQDFQTQTSKSLLTLLALGRKNYSTLDQDKIYGILGISSENDSFRIKPDYKKSVNEVYTNLAVSIIEQHHSLEILSHVGLNSTRIRRFLPLWVPDWEIHPRATPFALHPRFTQMQAGGIAAPIIRFSSDDQICHAHGRIFDRVTYVGDSFIEFIPSHGSLMRGGLGRWQGATDPWMKLRVRQWEHMAAKLKSYPTGEDIMDVYASTLVAGARIVESDEINCVTTRAAYEVWRKSYLVTAQKRGRFVEEVQNGRELSDIQISSKYLEAQIGAAYGRRFFTTEKGYMGLCACDVRIGHKVVILKGGRTPYVVKEERGMCLKFFGEAYIEGLMEGQALNMIDNWDELGFC